MDPLKIISKVESKDLMMDWMEVARKRKIIVKDIISSCSGS